MSSLGVHRLTVGDPTPALSVLDIENQRVTIHPTSCVVVFYRGHWCDHCCAQLMGLADDIDALRSAAVHVIAISSDDEPAHRAMHDLVGPEIRVYRDEGAVTITSLGLGDTHAETDRTIAQPSVFVIDAVGRVRYGYVGRDASDRPLTALIVLAAESLRAS